MGKKGGQAGPPLSFGWGARELGGKNKGRLRGGGVGRRGSRARGEERGGWENEEEKKEGGQKFIHERFGKKQIRTANGGGLGAGRRRKRNGEPNWRDVRGTKGEKRGWRGVKENGNGGGRNAGVLCNEDDEGKATKKVCWRLKRRLVLGA